MQSRNPAECLLQRLLQSEKIRNSYVHVLEDENGCTKISLHYLENTTSQTESFSERIYASESGRFFQNEKDFFVGN